MRIPSMLALPIGDAPIQQECSTRSSFHDLQMLPDLVVCSCATIVKETACSHGPRARPIRINVWRVTVCSQDQTGSPASRSLSEQFVGECGNERVVPPVKPWGIFSFWEMCTVYLKSRVSLTPYCSFPFLGSRNATAQISGV
jgi:hypothetical protein